MSKPTSIRLTEQAEAARSFLKEQMGGFNLQQAVNQTILLEARKRGWRGSEEDKEI